MEALGKHMQLTLLVTLSLSSIAESSINTDYLFCRRFQMHQFLLLRVTEAVELYDVYLTQKQDALG